MNRALDSERILRLIQLEIAEKSDNLEEVDFDDLCTSESLQRIRHQKRYSNIRFAHYVKDAKDLAKIEWDRPIEGNIFYVAIKQVVRKCLGFLVKPIVEKQNSSNETMVKLLEHLFRYVREKDRQIGDLVQEVKKKNSKES